MTTLASDAVRLPAVAGTFYPASRAALEMEVDRLLDEASPSRAMTCPKALVVPHAGLVYSGPVAASGYIELVPHAASIARIVLIGPAHRVRVEGVVSPGARWLRTPLGDIDVDTEALAAGGIPTSAAAHAREHSLEVEFPFLQRIVPSAKVVPLVVGRASAAEVARVLRLLWCGPETVVIVSSDLSHYLPYDLGRRVDSQTAARIVELDPAGLQDDEACGASAINGLLVVAREKGLLCELLDLRSSGDTAGPRDERDQVVGYGAFAFRE